MNSEILKVTDLEEKEEPKQIEIQLNSLIKKIDSIIIEMKTIDLKIIQLDQKTTEQQTQTQSELQKFRNQITPLNKLIPVPILPPVQHYVICTVIEITAFASGVQKTRPQNGRGPKFSGEIKVPYGTPFKFPNNETTFVIGNGKRIEFGGLVTIQAGFSFENEMGFKKKSKTEQDIYIELNCKISLPASTPCMFQDKHLLFPESHEIII